MAQIRENGSAAVVVPLCRRAGFDSDLMSERAYSTRAVVGILDLSNIPPCLVSPRIATSLQYLHASYPRASPHLSNTSMPRIPAHHRTVISFPNAAHSHPFICLCFSTSTQSCIPRHAQMCPTWGRRFCPKCYLCEHGVRSLASSPMPHIPACHPSVWTKIGFLGDLTK